MTILDTFDAAAFRQTLGSFATGIAVATCQAGDAPRGITINSLTSVSLEPPLVLFCLSDRTRIYEDFLAAPTFAFNILASGQEALSRHFSSPAAMDWSEIARHPAPQHPPLLADCMGWLICRRHAVYPGGDHAIIVGEVIALGHAPSAQPLLYFRKGYRQL